MERPQSTPAECADRSLDNPRIAMVIDPWYHPFNGTVVSTRRVVGALNDRFDFRILLAQAPGESIEEHCVGFARLRIPGINFILDRMKAPLGLPNRQKLQQVIKEADLLHVQFPFFLELGKRFLVLLVVLIPSQGIRRSDQFTQVRVELAKLIKRAKGDD